MSLYNDGFTAQAKFVASALATGAASAAIDPNKGLGFSIQFEYLGASPSASDAVFELWGDIPDATNKCIASGIAGNQAQLVGQNICYPNVYGSSSAPVLITVTIKAGTKQGDFCQGRPSCLPFAFMFVKAISGPTASFAITALHSRLRSQI